MDPSEKSEVSAAKQQVQVSSLLEQADDQNASGQSVSNSELFYALPHTILADTTSNLEFLKWQVKVTLVLVLVVLFLKALPSPLIVNNIENDPQAITKWVCGGEEQCSDVQQGYESIILKKVNSFQRELKYFVKLNYQKFETLTRYFKTNKVDINEEITWIQIYAYRNGDQYGPVLYEKSGQDIYEILFDNQALIFIGEIHVLEEQSYIIKIYKRIRNVKSEAGRQLQLETGRQLQLDNDHAADNNQTAEATNTTKENNNNQTNSPTDTTNPQQDNQKQIKISIPLTVQLVRYSQFYTAVELIIRYVTLLVILFVRGETANSPAIFHYIPILTANPLIFIEIAFPTTLTNIVSTICSSMYIAYLAVFLYYCHRKLKNPRVDGMFRTGKLLCLGGLWVASIMRQLHLVNQTKVQFFQYILMAVVLVPLLHHLWKLYFIGSKTILHRNMLFIALTIYFLLLLFFSGYLVNYGWKKISSYLIVQIYACELCYLTSSFNKASPQQRNVRVQEQNMVSPPTEDIVIKQQPGVVKEEGERHKQLGDGSQVHFGRQYEGSKTLFIKVL